MPGGEGVRKTFSKKQMVESEFSEQQRETEHGKEKGQRGKVPEAQICKTFRGC